MNQSITSEARYRQRVLKYSYKHGVTQASIRFRRSRNAIYEWEKKYDGNSWKSLIDKSHRPHSHPAQHTEEEKALISRYYSRYEDDMLLLWQRIRDKGYIRNYKSMVRLIKKMNLREEQKYRKRKNKPYQRAEYPGQKIQVDVKFVPSYCVTNGKKYYQYTAVDECTRFTYREMYDEHSTYSSADFIEKLIKVFPFTIREVQTDNGAEFTNALLVKKSTHKTMFEAKLDENEIIYHRIRIATPRHNGKVERQHRIDEKRFYKKMKMYSLEDGRKQLSNYNKKSNSYVKICLDYRSPNEVIEEYLFIF